MARIAADMRAGEPQVLAEEMDQKQSRLYFGGALDSIDSYFNSDLRHRLSSSLRALECAVKGPRSRHADKVSFVFGRPPDIVNGLGLSGRKLGRLFDCGVVERLAGQEGFGILRLQWGETDIRQTDSCSLADARAVQTDLDRDAGRRIVADLPLELQVCASARGRRNRDLDLFEYFVGLKSGREEAGEKALDRYLSGAARADGDERRPERQHRGRMVVCGVAVSQIPTNGSLVPHQRVGDYRCGVHEDRVTRYDCRRDLKVAFPRERANPQKAVRFRNVVEIRYAVDVNDVRRRRQP